MSARKKQIKSQTIGDPIEESATATASDAGAVKQKKVKKPMFPRRNLLYIVSMIIRIIATLEMILVSLAVLWIALPLRLLNPVWRKFGLKNSQMPTDVLQRVWAKCVLFPVGVTVKSEGTEHLEDVAQVMMFSHASNIDAMALQAGSPINVKFVFKRSLLLFWYVFVCAYFYGHIPINRSNRASAIASLNNAGKIIAKYGRTIGIFPEGTRSSTGELQPFKKGAFHLAVSSKVPVVPVLLFGNYNLWPGGQLFPSSGEVVVRFKPRIEFNESESVDSLQDKVYNIMLKESRSPPKLAPPGENPTNALITLFFLTPLIWYLWNLVF